MSGLKFHDPTLHVVQIAFAPDPVPAEQREVILLVGLEGIAYEEVALVLDVPVGTVRSRLSRGRDQLRRLMGVEQKQHDSERPHAA